MKNLLKFYNPLKQKVLYFLLKEDYEKDKYRDKSKLKMLKKKHPEGYLCECNDLDELLKALLNLSKNLINYIVDKEDNGNANSDTFYEILYIGLQNQLLSWQEIKDKLDNYYEQNKITEIQYQTLKNQYYLTEKEWDTE